jgi:hypothetical protein
VARPSSSVKACAIVSPITLASRMTTLPVVVCRARLGSKAPASRLGLRLRSRLKGSISYRADNHTSVSGLRNTDIILADGMLGGLLYRFGRVILTVFSHPCQVYSACSALRRFAVEMLNRMGLGAASMRVRRRLRIISPRQSSPI